MASHPMSLRSKSKTAFSGPGDAVRAKRSAGDVNEENIDALQMRKRAKADKNIHHPKGGIVYMHNVRKGRVNIKDKADKCAKHYVTITKEVIIVKESDPAEKKHVMIFKKPEVEKLDRVDFPGLHEADVTGKITTIMVECAKKSAHFDIIHDEYPNGVEDFISFQRYFKPVKPGRKKGKNLQQSRTKFMADKEKDNFNARIGGKKKGSKQTEC